MTKLFAILDSKCRNALNRARLWRLRMAGSNVSRTVIVGGRFTVLGAYHNLYIGPHTTINEGCFFNCGDIIRIGSYVHLSPYVQLHTGYLGMSSLPRTHLYSPITVEDHVWIASMTTIGAGTTIGRNSVVGAGSVVLEDVPPNTFVAGVPARVIKRLSINWLAENVSSCYPRQRELD